MATLRLRYEPDDDGTGELFGAVRTKHFAGAAAAWFSESELTEFANRIGEYPLKGDKPLFIEGGHWGRTAEPTLTQLHLRIEVTPHDAKGAVRVGVELATDFSDAKDAGLQERVVTRLIVTYADLARFQSSLRAMLKGSADEAILEQPPAN